MIAAGISNLSLVRYLIAQLAASPRAKFAELTAFVPGAKPEDWYSITAGQRVQVIKRDKKKIGVLQFGTEVVAASDGSIAGLLGASPGASTAVPIMLGLIEKCFPDRIAGWTPSLTRMIPTYGMQLSDDPALAARTIARTAAVLKIAP
jgi:malate dehydrogenase (quinone)